jgi:hypothetical protein
MTLLLDLSLVQHGQGLTRVLKIVEHLENTDAVISPHLDAAPPTKQDS